MRNWSARAEEINDLLIERKKATKRDIIKYIDNAIHRYTIKEREDRRWFEHLDESRPYKILNRGYAEDGESIWEKRLYPGSRWSETEKLNFIEESWVYINSPYDCTGQWFTWAIDVFNVPAGVVVYIFSAIDC